MPKTTSLPVYNWVKNVYSLCVNRGATCDFTYTTPTLTHLTGATMGAQTQTFTHFSTSFTPSLYTAFFSNFNLLMSHLYTLSTAPIITKTKEK